MNIPCPVRIDCPGVDEPILNDSSESPDVLYWSSYQWTVPPRPICLFCEQSFTQVDCFGVVHSSVSQADADLMAKAASVNCNKDENEKSCGNEEQTATVTCPNGNIVSYTVPAGTFLSTYTDAPAPGAGAAAEPELPAIVPTGIYAVLDSVTYTDPNTVIVLSGHHLTAGTYYQINYSTRSADTGGNTTLTNHSVNFAATGADHTVTETLVGNRTVVGLDIVEQWPEPNATVQRVGDDVVFTLTGLITGKSYWLNYQRGNAGSIPETIVHGVVVATGTSMTVTDAGVFDGFPYSECWGAQIGILP